MLNTFTSDLVSKYLQLCLARFHHPAHESGEIALQAPLQHVCPIPGAVVWSVRGALSDDSSMCRMCYKFINRSCLFARRLEQRPRASKRGYKLLAATLPNAPGLMKLGLLSRRLMRTCACYLLGRCGPITTVRFISSVICPRLSATAEVEII